MVILRACTECGALSDRQRCEAHRPRDTRPSAARRGYDGRWRRTRERFLAEHRVCEWPDGCVEAASDVHHLDGQGPLGPVGHHWPNLVALCGHHHKVVTAREQPGGWAAPARRSGGG